MDLSQAWDPEIRPIMTALKENASKAPPVAIHDIETRRAAARSFIEQIKPQEAAKTEGAEITIKDYYTVTSDDHKLLLRWYSPAATTTTTASGPGTSAIIYVHGGGMIMGSVSDFDPGVKAAVVATGVSALSIEYRLAPESKAPTQVNDVYAGLLWLHSHASELGVDRSRIGIFGLSAGGGIAAGTALMARDKNLQPPLAIQMLVYPMLDDRTITKHERYEENFFLWSTEDNITAWSALLGWDVSKPDEARGKEVSVYAAPARVESLKGLPRAYVDVGGLDRFVDETVSYAGRMIKAGVEVELHVRPGLPHAYEGLAPGVSASARSATDRGRVIRSI